MVIILVNIFIFLPSRASDRSYLVTLKISIHSVRILIFFSMWPFSSNLFSKCMIISSYFCTLMACSQKLSDAGRKDASRSSDSKEDCFSCFMKGLSPKSDPIIFSMLILCFWASNRIILLPKWHHKYEWDCCDNESASSIIIFCMNTDNSVKIESGKFLQDTVPEILLSNIASCSDMESPRLFRRKPKVTGEVRAFWSRKLQKRSQPGQTITYISPQKLIAQPHTPYELCSLNGSVSVSSLRIPSLDCESFQSLLPKPSVGNNKLSQYKQPNISTNQQYWQLNAKYQQLTKKYQKLSLRNTQLLQNQTESLKQKELLTTHNQQLQKIIYDKDIMIKQLKTEGFLCDQQLQRHKEAEQFYHTKCSHLESIIEAANRKLQQSYCHSNNVENESQLRSELERCKSEIVGLEAMIKYSTIYEDMGKKIKYDYENQVEKNAKLKAQNKKLMGKIECLLRDAEFKVAKNKKSVMQKRRRDSEISFEFSPEHERR